MGLRGLMALVPKWSGILWRLAPRWGNRFVRRESQFLTCQVCGVPLPSLYASEVAANLWVWYLGEKSQLENSRQLSLDSLPEESQRVTGLGKLTYRHTFLFSFCSLEAFSNTNYSTLIFPRTLFTSTESNLESSNSVKFYLVHLLSQSMAQSRRMLDINLKFSFQKENVDFHV